MNKTGAVILRTGHRHGSGCEWDQHLSRTRRLGLAVAPIASLKGPLEAIAPEDRANAGEVDKLPESVRLSGDRQAEIEALPGLEGTPDLIASPDVCSTLAFLANTAKLQPDAKLRTELDKAPAP